MFTEQILRLIYDILRYLILSSNLNDDMKYQILLTFLLLFVDHFLYANVNPTKYFSDDIVHSNEMNPIPVWIQQNRDENSNKLYNLNFLELTTDSKDKLENNLKYKKSH